MTADELVSSITETGFIVYVVSVKMLSSFEARRAVAIPLGPVHTKREHANLRTNPLMLLTCKFNAHSHNRFHLHLRVQCVVDGALQFVDTLRNVFPFPHF